MLRDKINASHKRRRVDPECKSGKVGGLGEAGRGCLRTYRRWDEDWIGDKK